MVKIQTAADDTPVMTNPLLDEKKKKFRLTRFTSSASLILSWPFPIIILCFQTNQRLLFDPRIYALLFSAFLVSGFFKRLFIKPFLPPSLFNALSPAIINLIGNGVFVTALYKSNWNWISLLFMTLSRLVFGWSTYSALDYSRRAQNVARQGVPNTIQDRVADMAPDLQDATFHVGVIISMVLCFILEICLRNVGAQLAEFYSMLIISGFSIALSLCSAPCLHSAVRNLINVEEAVHATPTDSSNQQQPTVSSTQMCRRTNTVTLRQRFILSNLLQAISRHEYTQGQLLVTLFSGISTASAICVDYLLLPYLLASTRANFLKSSSYFPFPEFLFVYACLFITEAGLRYLLLEYSPCPSLLNRQPPSVLLGGLLLISLGLALTPILLFAAGQSTNSSTSLTGFIVFVFCLLEGTMKAGHMVISGVLFARYCDAIILKSVAQTAEQLVGLIRCFLTSLLFLITGAVLYHQLYMATLATIAVTQSIALSIGICGWVDVYAKERALRVSTVEAE